MTDFQGIRTTLAPLMGGAYVKVECVTDLRTGAWVVAQGYISAMHGKSACEGTVVVSNIMQDETFYLPMSGILAVYDGHGKLLWSIAE